jgi:hypothetical protein
MKYLRLLLIILLVWFSASQTSCDYELDYVSTAMGNFNTRGYYPLNVEKIYDQLNDLRASILAAYQLCLGKIIIDPDSLYAQDISGCFSGLYNVSGLAAVYTGNYAKIRS